LHIDPKPADFSGDWVIDEDRSSFGNMGAGFAPARIEVVQKEGKLSVKTTRITEMTDDQVTEETLSLDGSESKSQFMNSPRVTRAHLSDARAEIAINSTVSFAWAGNGAKMTVNETWRLLDGGRRLSIKRSSSSPRGNQEMTMIFDKR